MKKREKKIIPILSSSSHSPKMTTGFSLREKKIEVRSSFSFLMRLVLGCEVVVGVSETIGEFDRFLTLLEGEMI